MKRTMMLLTITLGAFLLIATSFSPARLAKALNQSKANTAQTKPQPRPLPTPIVPVDIDGKRLPEGEKYVAQRTLKDGKIIAYRQNKREVEALVKGLKEDGVTDKKLLAADHWLAFTCYFTGMKTCGHGCGSVPCNYHEARNDGADQTGRLSRPSNVNAKAVGYCSCP